MTEQVAVNLTVTDNSDSQWRGVTIDPIFVTLEDNDVRQDIPGYQYGVYVVPGDANESFNLNFIWQQRLGSYDNELGFFIADDVNGTVNGILPTEPTYSQVALSDESNQVIFASGQGAGAEASFSVPGGSHVVFYMVQDNTRESFLANNPANELSQQPLTFFSVIEANPDDFNHVRTSQSGANTWQFGWEDIEGGGDESFTDAVLELSVQRSDTQDQLVALDLVVVDNDGNVLNEDSQAIRAGQVFSLEVRARDLRSTQSGVFSIYADIQYDPSLVELAGQAVFADIVQARNGDFSSPGLIDELGGVVSSSAQIPDSFVIATIPFRGIGSGSLTFTSNPADIVPDHQTTLLGRNSPVATDAIQFGSQSIEIALQDGIRHNSVNALDVNNDGRVTPLDALLVINYLAGSREAPAQSSTTDEAIVQFIDTNDDGSVTALDALLVINDIARRSQVLDSFNESEEDTTTNFEQIDNSIVQLF